VEYHKKETPVSLQVLKECGEQEAVADVLLLLLLL
jgi:hypothetical protein